MKDDFFSLPVERRIRLLALHKAKQTHTCEDENLAIEYLLSGD